MPSNQGYIETEEGETSTSPADNEVVIDYKNAAVRPQVFAATAGKSVNQYKFPLTLNFLTRSCIRCSEPGSELGMVIACRSCNSGRNC